MIKQKFYLRQPNSQQQSPIFLICHWQGYSLKHSPGISVDVNLWNKKEGVYRQTKDNPHYKHQNSRLKAIQRQVEDSFYATQSELNRVPSKSELKEAIDKALRNEVQKQQKCEYFMDYVNQLIAKKKNENLTMGITNKKNCITSSYNQTAKVLMDFAKSDVTFKSINQYFYQKFVEYCVYDRDYKPNNIGKHIRNIKSVMNKALEDELHNNTAFRKFFKPSEEVETIHLNPDEITQIYNLQLGPKDLHLKGSRDLFVIACWTALRYSDWGQYSKLYKHQEQVSLTTIKTGAKVVLPTHPIIKEISARYNQDLPTPKANQPLNRDLKIIAQLAGINTEIEVTTVKGGKRLTKMVPKHELITTHTARRSFATNTYNMGVPIYDIMQITSHKTEKSFLKYIKITKDEAAKRIQAIFDNT